MTISHALWSDLERGNDFSRVPIQEFLAKAATGIVGPAPGKQVTDKLFNWFDFFIVDLFVHLFVLRLFVFGSVLVLPLLWGNYVCDCLFRMLIGENIDQGFDRWLLFLQERAPVVQREIVVPEGWGPG